MHKKRSNHADCLMAVMICGKYLTFPDNGHTLNQPDSTGRSKLQLFGPTNEQTGKKKFL